MRSDMQPGMPPAMPPGAPLPARDTLGPRLFAVRLGKIFFNLSVVAMVLCLCGVLSVLAIAVFLLIGLVAILITLGLVFAIVPDFVGKMIAAAEVSAQISTFFLENFAVFAAVAIGGAVVSLVLLATDKYARHTGRIVVASLVIAVTLLVVAVVLIGGAQ